MKYSDVIKFKYPDYVLTRVGTGLDYNQLEWSDFNPSPNPIPKATLDADIAYYLANNISIPSGDLTDAQEEDLLGIVSLGETSGLIKKLGHGLYTIDESQYLTSITSTLVANALGYSPYDSSNPNNYVTQSYVDNLTGTGIIWLTPVHAFNFIGTASAPPASAVTNDNYIISNGGNIGVWSTFSPGDRVSYQNGTWVLREVTTVPCRLGIAFDKTNTPIGDAAGKQNYIGEIIGGDAINGWVWEWTAPVNNYAVFNNLATSTKFGQAYTYVGSESKWIMFSSSNVGDGSGLSYSGTTLNVNTGYGIKISADHVVSNLYSTGGLITTLDGTTSSTDDNAGLSLSPLGTPGTYTKLTTDVYGRITAGSNPTTLSGYNITDAVNTSLLGSNGGIATLDNAGRLTLTQLPDFKTVNSISVVGAGNIAVQPTLVSGTNIQSINGLSILTSGNLNLQSTLVSGTNIKTINNNNLLGSGNLDVQPLLVSGANIKTIAGYSLVGTGNQPIAIDDLSDVVITTPTIGQAIIYNGTNWVNLGQTGQANGGGAAKRIWSNNIPASSGTTLITPGTAAPLVTAGTQIFTVTITPYSTTASYVIQSNIAIASSLNNANLTLALFRDNTYIGGTLQIVSSGTNSQTLSFSITDAPNTTNPITYQVRVGTTSGTWYVNRRSSEITYGGYQTGWVMWEY